MTPDTTLKESLGITLEDWNWFENELEQARNAQINDLCVDYEKDFNDSDQRLEKIWAALNAFLKPLLEIASYPDAPSPNTELSQSHLPFTDKGTQALLGNDDAVLMSNQDRQRLFRSGIRSAQNRMLKGLPLKLPEDIVGTTKVVLAKLHERNRNWQDYCDRVIADIKQQNIEFTQEHEEAMRATLDRDAADLLAVALFNTHSFHPDVESYPLKAAIWKRKTQDAYEWVLEIAGVINDTHFTNRHTQSLKIAPQDVAGLPELYSHKIIPHDASFEIRGGSKGFSVIIELDDLPDQAGTRRKEADALAYQLSEMRKDKPDGLS
jgi:hypothetical protein